MNASKKEFILRGWEPLENEVIVKDVATKGENINVALSFLAKRLDCSAECAKDFFNQEVDKYVVRLLNNRQLFKADHVLNNVGRDSRFLFYEFARQNTENDINRDLIISHLKKAIPNFEQQMDELNLDLKILDLCQVNRTMNLKYRDSLRTFSLEALNENGKAFRNMLIVDVFLTLKPDLDLNCLDKHSTWTYFLENDLYHQMVKWLDIQYEIQKNTYRARLMNSFQSKLETIFSTWTIDKQMIASVLNSDSNLSEPLRNSLAKHGIFIIKEQKDVQRILQRIFTSESWIENSKILETKALTLHLTRLLLSNGLSNLVIENFVTQQAIEDVKMEFPSFKNEIELSKSLKDLQFENINDFAVASKEISTFLQKYNSNFYPEHPIILLFELMLFDANVSTILESTEMKTILLKIPFLQAFLKKLESSTDLNDHNLNLNDLVKQSKNIDLRQIQLEAGTEDLNFANANLIAKHSKPTQLGFTHYLNQRRSSYSIYAFFIEQLQDYAQITNRQIMVACGTASELALNNFSDHELVTHCMSFIEMLGVNSMNVRAYLKCLHLAKLYSPGTQLEMLNETQLFDIVRKSIINIWHRDQFDPRNFEALLRAYHSKNLDLPKEFLQNIAETSNWFQFLLFASYYGYQIQQIIELCEQSFGIVQVGKNLAKAIQYECAQPIGMKVRRNSTLSYRERRKQVQIKPDTNSITSGETISSSLSSTEGVNISKLDPTKFLSTKNNTDLYAIILQCTILPESTDKTTLQLTLPKFVQIYKNPSIVQSSTELNLLRMSIELKWPLLSILAATVRPELKPYCWIVWLLTSSDTNVCDECMTDFSDMAKAIIEDCILKRFIRTLYQSIQIFYPESNFCYFTEYLTRIADLDFSAEVTELLKSYLIALSRNEQPLECINAEPPEILNYSINILLTYLSIGLKSPNHQIQMLQSLCESGIDDFVNTMDFGTVKKILKIVNFTSISIHIDLLRRDKYSETDIRLEYEHICEQLITEKAFDKAMEVADLLNIPKDTMIYESWIYNYETNKNFNFDKCEQDAETHCTQPAELLISFYIHSAEKLGYANSKKYEILKKVLNVIKKNHLFPNESFNRDQIEYEMILSFLKNSQTIDDIELYHSEYFECIMSNERFVLYKSFMELKEMAGVDDLTVGNKKFLNEQEIGKLEDLINRLLDKGDIVEALRVQAIFNHRPLDLHYLVFCMALAEGLATLYDLSIEQRQMLTDGAKIAFSRFNRRTLDTKRFSLNGSTSAKQSGGTNGGGDSSDTSGNMEFEEIPSREKQVILDALQSLAAKVKHGSKIAQRIAMTWRAALYLDKDYVDVLKTKDHLILLQNAIDEDCLNKLIVMSDVMVSSEMSQQEIAVFLAQQIATSIIKSRFYIIQNQMNPMNMSQNSLWGYDLDREFRMFLELCPNTSMLGNNLLKYCDALKIYRKFDLNKDTNPDLTQENEDIAELFLKLRTIMEDRMLSHKKQNTITVELLIKAHDCFVHECYMEGIVMVLQRTKLLNNVLANAKSWNLIVKMLMGIGRYRDMYYCFETLIANDQFESLLGQFDDDGINGLKQAILSYLHEYCPDNKEFFRLAALHFMMYKEIAEMWENETNDSVAKLTANYEIKNNENGGGQHEKNPDQINTISYLKCKPDIVLALNSIMEGYAHAAENYLLDNKLALAQRTANQAELIAVQINLVTKQLEKNMDCCVSVLNIRLASTMRQIVNTELSVPQSMILNRAYPYEINWTDAIFSQYILNENTIYLGQYCERMELTECMIESMVKSFQHEANITNVMEQNISNLVEMVQSVSLRYKLASLLGLKRIISNLINEHSSFYLKDINYGRTEAAL